MLAPSETSGIPKYIYKYIGAAFQTLLRHDDNLERLRKKPCSAEEEGAQLQNLYVQTKTLLGLSYKDIKDSSRGRKQDLI